MQEFTKTQLCSKHGGQSSQISLERDWRDRGARLRPKLVHPTWTAAYVLMVRELERFGGSLALQQT